MTPLAFVLFACAGGVGAAARFFLDGFINSHLKTAFPWATTIINVSGSLVLGFITGLTIDSVLPAGLGVVAATGFLGGYTTFSTASFETVQLLRQKRYLASITSGVGMLLLSVLAAIAGLSVGLAF